MHYAEYGIPIGDRSLGNLIAHGIGLVGPFFFILVIPLFLIVFIALQSLTAVAGSSIVIAPVIMLQLMQVYYLAGNDSLMVPIYFILRGLAQDIFLYWLVYKATRWFSAQRLLQFGYPNKNISSTTGKVT